MRRNQAHVPTPAFPEYRIRFRLTDQASKIMGSDVATAHPGIIKRNRPKADRYLAAIASEREAWIEKRDSAVEEWERIG